MDNTSGDNNRRPRRWRYTLRTGLVLLTALCVLFGWLINAIHVQQRKKRARQTLRQNGYALVCERIESGNGLSAATWLDLIGFDFLDEVVAASNHTTEVSLVQLKELEKFKYLRILSFKSKDLSDFENRQRIRQERGLTRLLPPELQTLFPELPDPDSMKRSQSARESPRNELSSESLHVIGSFAGLDFLGLTGLNLAPGQLVELAKLKSLESLKRSPRISLAARR